MALENRQKGKYITILGGKFSQKVDENTEGAVMRTNKLGKNVWELFYDSFTGQLTGISIKDSNDYGKTWNFHFVDEGEEYHIQLSYSNSYAKALLKMLPNIDVSKPFTLSPSLKMVDGKNQSSLFVYQDGNPIKHAYTKDTPDYPKMKKIKVKGKESWDDSDQLDFLLEMVNRDIMPKLDQAPIENTKDEADVEKATSLDDF